MGRIAIFVYGLVCYAMFLAVFKPWGRIRGQYRSTRRIGNDRRHRDHPAATDAKS